MERDRLLTATSLIAVALMTVHLSDDIARGFEPGGLTNLGGVLILVVWLAAILLLRTTRWGHVLLILGSLFTALMPVVHMSGNGVGRVAASSGGHFFASPDEGESWREVATYLPPIWSVETLVIEG